MTQETFNKQNKDIDMETNRSYRDMVKSMNKENEAIDKMVKYFYSKMEEFGGKIMIRWGRRNGLPSYVCIFDKKYTDENVILEEIEPMIGDKTVFWFDLKKWDYIDNRA
jgi:hypothetical protein